MIQGRATAGGRFQLTMHACYVCMRAMYVYSAHSTRAPARKNRTEAHSYSKISVQKHTRGGREAPPSPAGGGACVVSDGSLGVIAGFARCIHTWHACIHSTHAYIAYIHIHNIHGCIHACVRAHVCMRMHACACACMHVYACMLCYACMPCYACMLCMHACPRFFKVLLAQICILQGFVSPDLDFSRFYKLRL